MTKQTQDLDPVYEELLEFFDDEAVEIAAHFRVSRQAVFLWRTGVPITRQREFRLLQRMQKASEGLK